MHVLVSAINRLDDLLDSEDQEVHTRDDKTSTDLVLLNSNYRNHRPKNTDGLLPLPMEIDENLPSLHPAIDSENTSNTGPSYVIASNLGENLQISASASPEQIAQEEHSVGVSNPVVSGLGTVSSAPCSPHVDPNILEKSEKYDDLSESD